MPLKLLGGAQQGKHTASGGTEEGGAARLLVTKPEGWDPMKIFLRPAKKKKKKTQ